GIITEEKAQNLEDQEAVDLIFAPGFSTAEEVTDISGRGVGMDVVKNNIKNLKGSVLVSSQLGKGTKFVITLPLTLAIIDALMVKVAGQTYAIPLDAVSETTKIEAAKLSEINNRKAVTLRGEVLGLAELAELLELEINNQEREVLPVVIIIVGDRRLGLVVDTLLERQEVVIKSLGEYMGEQPGISGATIMGDGSVVLILDPHEIYKIATYKG
ncbi:MAG: chemotaxis protein CheA, partial [Desulfonatronovibrionaceae bacterium]